jgi:hypothetical protein
MGQVSNNSVSILSNEFLSDEELINVLEIEQHLIQNKELEQIKKDLHEFCVLILETFRNEKKNKH